MSKENPNPENQEKLSGVRAKLAAHKAREAEHFISKTLPKSGVEFSFPGFINHGAWMIAQRQAKGDIPTAQAAFVAQVVKFEGEKLTLTDLRELCDAQDVLFMVNQIFGDDDEEDEGPGKPQVH